MTWDEWRCAEPAAAAAASGFVAAAAATEAARCPCLSVPAGHSSPDDFGGGWPRLIQGPGSTDSTLCTAINRNEQEYTDGKAEREHTKGRSNDYQTHKVIFISDANVMYKV